MTTTYYKPTNEELVHMKLLKELEKKMKLVKPKVDDKAPKLPIQLYYKPKILESDCLKLQKIITENKKLVDEIANIQRRKPSKEFWMEKCLKPPSNYKTRLANLMKITKENFKLCNIIYRKQSAYALKLMLEDWHKNERIIQAKSRFPLFWHIKQDALAEQREKPLTIRMFGKESEAKVDFEINRSRCFFDVILESNCQKLGRIIFELYDDYCPKTVKNFISLCSENEEKRKSYRNCPFHMIVRDVVIVGGDITKGNGTGGVSSFGGNFEDESFAILHKGEGVLTMANRGPHTNNSIFYITLTDLPSLDEKNVAFGRVSKGFDTLYKMQEFTTQRGHPVTRIIISNCGLITQKSKIK